MINQINNRKRIVLGSRKSKLALWQTNYIRDLLLDAWPQLEVEIQIIKERCISYVEINPEVASYYIICNSCFVAVSIQVPSSTDATAPLAVHGPALRRL